MKFIKFLKNITISFFLIFITFDSINCDLLVRSPNELKSQFISMSISN